LKKLETDSEEEEPVQVKRVLKKKVEPKKVKRVKPDVLETDSEGLQRRNPLLFNYPTYV